MSHTPCTCHNCTALVFSLDLTSTMMTHIHHVLHSPLAGVKNRVAHRTQCRYTAIIGRLSKWPSVGPREATPPNVGHTAHLFGGNQRVLTRPSAMPLSQRLTSFARCSEKTDAIDCCSSCMAFEVHVTRWCRQSGGSSMCIARCALGGRRPHRFEAQGTLRADDGVAHYSNHVTFGDSVAACVRSRTRQVSTRCGFCGRISKTLETALYPLAAVPRICATTKT